MEWLWTTCERYYCGYVTHKCSDAAANNTKLSDEMRENLAANLAKLDKKESYFLDLAAEEEWPKDKLREKLAAIRDDRKRIERRLEHAENQLDDGIQFLTLALDMNHGSRSTS
jgi:hypothetical protein